MSCPAAVSFFVQLEIIMIKNIPANTAQTVWEVLNAALYDLTQGNHEDGISALEEAISLLENETTKG